MVRSPGKPAVDGAAGGRRQELGFGLREMGERERKERNHEPDRTDDPGEVLKNTRISSLKALLGHLNGEQETPSPS